MILFKNCWKCKIKESKTFLLALKIFDIALLKIEFSKKRIMIVLFNFTIEIEK